MAIPQRRIRISVLPAAATIPASMAMSEESRFGLSVAAGEFDGLGSLMAIDSVMTPVTTCASVVTSDLMRLASRYPYP